MHGRSPVTRPLLPAITALLLAAAAGSLTVPEHVRPDPVASTLVALADSRGLETALDELQELARQDRTVAVRVHDLAHALGMHVYARTRDPRQADAGCARRFNFGCIHGMIEAHVLELGSLDAAVLGGVCGGVFSFARDTEDIGTCWHGIGHALQIRRGDIWAALADCAGLVDPGDRLCAAGAFMEHSGIATGMTSGSQRPRAYRADDPLWPCTDARVREPYRAPCYAMQGMSLFHGLGGIRPAADRCGRIEGYRADCWRGIGFAVFVAHPLVTEPPERIAGYCADAGEGREDCLVGVVSDLDFPFESALAVCAGLERERTRSRCYFETGRRIRYQVEDPDARRAVCRRLPEEHVGICEGTGGRGTPAR